MAVLVSRKLNMSTNGCVIWFKRITPAKRKIPARRQNRKIVEIFSGFPDSFVSNIGFEFMSCRWQSTVSLDQVGCPGNYVNQASPTMEGDFHMTRIDDSERIMSRY